MATIEEIVERIAKKVIEKSVMTSASPNKENTFERFNETGLIGESEEIEDAIREIVRESLDDIQAEKPAEKQKDTLDTTPSPSISFLTPQGATSTITGAAPKVLAESPDILLEVFRKLPPVAIAFLAASLAPHIFKYITRPGSELDLRYIRDIDEERNAFLSRQQQYDTAAGFRQVITTSTTDGFLAVNGANNENTLRLFRKGPNFYGELFDIVNGENAKGLFS